MQAKKQSALPIYSAFPRLFIEREIFGWRFAVKL